MPNQWFNFKQFKVWQKESAFKVGTDGVLLGAWCEVKDNSRILDVGTGTGLIALMTAQRSEADIVAIEPDKSSAAEASLNIAKSLHFPAWEMQTVNRLAGLLGNMQRFAEAEELASEYSIRRATHRH